MKLITLWLYLARIVSTWQWQILIEIIFVLSNSMNSTLRCFIYASNSSTPFFPLMHRAFRYDGVTLMARNKMRERKRKMRSDVILFFSLSYIAYCTRNDCALNTKNDFHRINQIAYALVTDRQTDSRVLSVCRYLYYIYLFCISDNNVHSNGYIFNA